MKKKHGKVYYDKQVKESLWDRKRGMWYRYESDGRKTTRYPFPFKTKPYKHQHQALFTADGQKAFAYFMDPGTGKTKIVVDEAQVLTARGLLHSVLVICPKSVMGPWIREIMKHGHYRTWEIYRWKEGIINEIKAPDMRWFVMNVDALIQPKTTNTPNGYASALNFLLGGASMVAVDESTSIKNPDAQRTLAAWTLARRAEYRRILTGTPIANNPLDLYAQLYFLDPAIVNRWSFNAFRSHFAVLDEYRNVISYKNLDELNTIVSRVSFQVKIDDCLDLPPNIYERREIELSAHSVRSYNKVVTELFSWFSDRQLTPVTAGATITKAVKLRQITGGAVLNDEGDAVKVGDEKIKEVLALLDEYPSKKMIVWCQFTHEIDRLVKVLSIRKIPTVKLDGSMSGKARDVAMESFETGDARVIVVQNDAGHEGITLNAAGLNVYFTNSLSHKVRTQSEGRSRRPGQTKSVVHVDLVAVGTIDEVVLELLESKHTVAEYVLSGEGSLESKIDDMVRGRRKLKPETIKEKKR